MSGEKTEKPTPKRLRDAREKGETVKSREIPSVLLLSGFALLLLGAGPWYSRTLKSLLAQPFQCLDAGSKTCLADLLEASGRAVVLLSLPALAVACFLSLAGHMGQSGWLFTFHPVLPDLNRLNPAGNLKKIVSPESLFDLGLNVVKLAVLATVFALLIAAALDTLVRAVHGGVPGLPPVVALVMEKLFRWSLPAFAVLAAADFFYRRARFLARNRMTREEVKREYREMEGDPHIKSQRRQLQQEMAMHDNLERTRRASVLITNPTHLAVALFYDEKEGNLPVILGKGQGWIAQRMMEIAAQEGIPVMRDIPLARALYAEGAVDHYIPSDLIRPVAETLRWARDLKLE